MPEVVISIDPDARAAYLELYREQGVERVHARMRDVWSVVATWSPWEEMVVTHRAIQAFAYLNDPDAETNIARYPLIAAGIPTYGPTNAEVAASFVQYQQATSGVLNDIYGLHKAAVANVQGAADTTAINTYVQQFVAATDWIITP